MKPGLLLLLTLVPAATLAAQRPKAPARPARPKPAIAAPTPAPAAPAPEAPWRWDFEPPWPTPAPFVWEAPPALEAPLALETPPALEVPFPPDPVDFDFDEGFGRAAFDLAWDRGSTLGLWTPAPGVVTAFADGFGLRAPAFARGAPTDSLYRMAREALNRGEYRRAAELFRRFEETNPGSRYVAASMYWRAFARYRAGREEDLRVAVQVLDEQRRRFPEARDDADVRVLVTRVTGALAARGDTDAVRQLREGAGQDGKPCDREDMEVRSEALSALAGTDPSSVTAVIGRVLADRDECTVPLRRRAIYLLGKTGETDAADALLDAAKNDPSAEVRSDAIGRLAQLPGDRQVVVLSQLIQATTDEATQRAVVAGLRRIEDQAARAELKRIIEREDLSERVRTDAIRSLGRGSWSPMVVSIGGDRGVKAVRRGEGGSLADADAAYLRSLYGRAESRSVKLAIVETLARNGGDSDDAWLMGIVRDPSEDGRFRSAALSRLRRSDVSVVELAKLYDTLTDRELRSAMVSILGERTEPDATDKLLEIAKRDTDPTIRRRAISALARKKDPRTTKLLLDLVER